MSDHTPWKKYHPQTNDKPPRVMALITSEEEKPIVIALMGLSLPILKAMAYGVEPGIPSPAFKSFIDSVHKDIGRASADSLPNYERLAIALSRIITKKEGGENLKDRNPAVCLFTNSREVLIDVDGLPNGIAADNMLDAVDYLISHVPLGLALKKGVPNFLLDKLQADVPDIFAESGTSWAMALWTLTSFYAKLGEQAIGNTTNIVVPVVTCGHTEHGVNVTMFRRCAYEACQKTGQCEWRTVTGCGPETPPDQAIYGPNVRINTDDMLVMVCEGTSRAVPIGAESAMESAMESLIKEYYLHGHSPDVPLGEEREQRIRAQSIEKVEEIMRAGPGSLAEIRIDNFCDCHPWRQILMGMCIDSYDSDKPLPPWRLEITPPVTKGDDNNGYPQ